MSKHIRRVVFLVAPVLAVAALAPAPSVAVTQAEVDEACGEYRDAVDILDAAVAERNEAQAQVARLYADREVIAGRVDRLQDQIAERYEELEVLRTAVVDWAVESYMTAIKMFAILLVRWCGVEA